MMKSSAAEQKCLIELQDLDLHLARLDHQMKTLPILRDLARAQAGLESHDALAIASATEKSDIEVELQRSENDVEQVVARISKDQHFIDSGQASAKDLQNLLGELESLNRRKEELEEVELAIMVRLEDAESRRAHHLVELSRFKSEVDQLTQERDRALSEIEDKKREIRAEREAKAAAVSTELVDLYMKISGSNGGIGAARLKDGQCEGCHLSINAVELSRIRSLPDDELVRCEECRRILVRV